MSSKGGVPLAESSVPDKVLRSKTLTHGKYYDVKMARVAPVRSVCVLVEQQPLSENNTRVDDAVINNLDFVDRARKWIQECYGYHLPNDHKKWNTLDIRIQGTARKYLDKTNWRTGEAVSLWKTRQFLIRYYGEGKAFTDLDMLSKRVENGEKRVMEARKFLNYCGWDEDLAIDLCMDAKKNPQVELSEVYHVWRRKIYTNLKRNKNLTFSEVCEEIAENGGLLKLDQYDIELINSESFPFAYFLRAQDYNGEEYGTFLDRQKWADVKSKLTSVKFWNRWTVEGKPFDNVTKKTIYR